jgi:hypothetical protein
LYFYRTGDRSREAISTFLLPAGGLLDEVMYSLKLASANLAVWNYIPGLSVFSMADSYSMLSGT